MVKYCISFVLMVFAFQKSNDMHIINNICSNMCFDATEKSIKFYLIFSVRDFFPYHFSQCEYRNIKGF